MEISINDLIESGLMLVIHYSGTESMQITVDSNDKQYIQMSTAIDVIAGLLSANIKAKKKTVKMNKIIFLYVLIVRTTIYPLLAQQDMLFGITQNLKVIRY